MVVFWDLCFDFNKLFLLLQKCLKIACFRTSPKDLIRDKEIRPIDHHTYLHLFDLLDFDDLSDLVNLSELVNLLDHVDLKDLFNLTDLCSS